MMRAPTQRSVFIRQYVVAIVVVVGLIGWGQVVDAQTPVEARAFPSNPACADTEPPPWVTDPEPDRRLADGTTLGETQTLIWELFESADCVGNVFVRIAQCEGLNNAGQWDPAYINPWDHVGWFQVSWVHGREGGVVAGRWPEAAQTTLGNAAAALELYRQAGFSPWYPWSGHCWA